MLITLRIENADLLPEGGPRVFTARNQGFEIGREARAWTLPDPDRIISGRHCEVRYQSDGFWLYDVSRNGTFLNGSDRRLGSPRRLAQGDRLRIGRYTIAVSIDDERNTGEDAAGRPAVRPGAAQFGANPSSGPARENASVVLADEPYLPPSGVPAPPTANPPRPGPAGSVSSSAVDPDDLLGWIAEGAGISPEAFGQRDPRELATEIGAVLRVAVEQLSQLLKARAAAKVLSKSGHRTMVGSTDNNPLKFVPTVDEMLDIMFSRRRGGYLDAKGSVEEAFRDLKTHELATYAAMQSALAQLLDDLSPEAIESKVPPSTFTSAKSRAWDAFVAAWTAREEAHENGMLDVFLSYFGEAYSKASRRK